MNNRPHSKGTIDRMGKLILFEGVDGVGKSSVVKSLCGELINDGYSVATYREPGSTPLGEEIRVLLTNKALPSSQIAKLFLFFSARHNLLPEIHESLNKYDFVLMDRYTPSTLAYQSVSITGSDMTNAEDMDLIRRLYNIDTINPNFIIPDLTIWLHADHKVCVERIQRRKAYSAISEYEVLSKLTRIQNQYSYVMSFLRQKGWAVNNLSTTNASVNELTIECERWISRWVKNE